MKRFILLINLLFVFLFNYAQNPALDWVKGFGGAGAEFTYSLAVDASDNIFVSCYFEDTVDFDPGLGVLNLYSSNGTGALIKLDPTGNLIWAKQFGSDLETEPEKIHIDAQGNIFLTGNFSNSGDFDPGLGTYTLSTNGIGQFVFLLKLDSSGNFQWAKSWGVNLTATFCRGIATDPRGNVYAIGSFPGSVDFDPGPGTQSLSSNGLYDVYLTKLDSFGNFVWVKQFGGSYADHGYAMHVDPWGGIYVGGAYGTTVDFDPNGGTFNLTVNGGVDAFLTKLDTSGNFIWAKSFGSAWDDRINCMRMDVNANIYLSGFFGGTVDFDPSGGNFLLSAVNGGYSDPFILKLDAAGDFVNAVAFGGPSYDYSVDLALDPLGNIIVTGELNSTGDFDPGIGVYNLSSAGSTDIFILHLDPAMNFQGAHRIGGPLADAVKAIAANSTGEFYVAGNFRDSIDFDPEAGQFFMASSGEEDVFVLKLNQVPLSITEDQLWGFNVYPNPSSGLFWVDLESDAKVEVCDMTGRIVQVAHLPAGLSLVDLQHQGNGLFLIHAFGDGFSATYHLFKVQ